MPVEQALPAGQTVMEEAQIDAAEFDDQVIEPRIEDLSASIAAVKAAFAQQSDQLSNVQILSDELQEQLGALSTANSDLESMLEEKAKALADREAELDALRQTFATRNEEFDLLSTRLSLIHISEPTRPY